MAAFEFALGTGITSTFTFRRNDVPADPDIVRFVVRHEDDAAPTISVWQGAMPITITRLDRGIYQAGVWTPAVYGTWYCEWQGEGNVDFTRPFSLYIHKSKVLVP